MIFKFEPFFGLTVEEAFLAAGGVMLRRGWAA